MRGVERKRRAAPHMWPIQIRQRGRTESRRDARGVRACERDVSLRALGQLLLLGRRGVPHVHRGVSAPHLLMFVFNRRWRFCLSA